MEFVKDALYVGKWYPPGREPVEFTPEDLTHHAKRLNEMVGAGLQVPLSWEHQDDAKPQTEADRKANKSKHTFGFLKSAAVHPDGYLTVVTDVPDAEDAKRMPKVRFVSPEILHDFKDGTGKVWQGASITHLAVTPRPVQHTQKPFQALPLSALRLSLSDLRLGDYGDPSDNKDKQPDTGQANDENSDSKPKASGHLGNLVKEMADVGLVLPGDTVLDNLVERLMTAVMTLKAAKKEGKDDEEPYPGTTPPTEAKPMQMSQDDRIAAMEGRLLSTEKINLRQRVASVYSSGRVSKPIHDKLLEDLEKQTLRLSVTGDIEPNPIVYRLEAYEALEVDTAWPASRRLSHEDATEVLRPVGQWGRPEKPEEVTAAVNQFFDMIPGGNSKSKSS